MPDSWDLLNQVETYEPNGYGPVYVPTGNYDTVVWPLFD